MTKNDRWQRKSSWPSSQTTWTVDKRHYKWAFLDPCTIATGTDSWCKQHPSMDMYRKSSLCHFRHAGCVNHISRYWQDTLMKDICTTWWERSISGCTWQITYTPRCRNIKNASRTSRFVKTDSHYNHFRLVARCNLSWWTYWEHLRRWQTLTNSCWCLQIVTRVNREPFWRLSRLPCTLPQCLWTIGLFRKEYPIRFWWTKEHSLLVSYSSYFATFQDRSTYDHGISFSDE